jgi:NAD(P)-dependent dehydrogenase (short-subunit alcohol dehydrogenase family)
MMASSASWNANENRDAAILGHVAVVTGATRGIGHATAMQLAQLGAEVVLVGRDERRLDAVRVEARASTGNERVSWVRADFASLVSVRVAAKEIARRWPAIHVLVNNAGVNVARRTTTVDGYEMTFAVNHLAPLLLTTLLLPALARGAPSRIVNVASVFAHFGRLNLDDLMYERRRYNSTSAYNQSKLANVMSTLELAAYLEGSGITVNCVSPGLVATDLLREHTWSAARWLRPLWQWLLMTPDRAARRVVRVATSDALATVTGHAFAGSGRPITVPRRARDTNARARLWELSQTFTNAPDVTAMLGAASGVAR